MNLVAPEGRNRLAAIAGGIAVIAAAAIVLYQPANDIVAERVLEGRVIDLSVRARESAVLDGGKSVGIATVELPDGGRAKVFVVSPFPGVGDRIALRLTEYDNGDRKVAPVVAQP